MVFAKYLQGNIKANFFFQRGSYGHLYSRLNEVEQHKNVDLLFLGSSHTYRGFDVRAFEKHGIQSFNLGSSAQSPTQTNILVSRYIDVLNPKLVVYEVYPQTLMIDGVESMLDLISNDEIDMLILQKGISTGNPKIFNSMVYACLSNLSKKKFVEPKAKGLDKYIKGGYVERKITYSTPKVFNKNRFKFNEKQKLEFEGVLQKLKQRKIPFILVFAPIPEGNYKSYENISDYEKKMRSYGLFENFNGKMSLSDSLHFYDHHHLNQDGVEIFNQYFIQYLKERKLLK